MPKMLCPKCNRVITFMDNIGGDFVHDCDSGNLTLDQQDVSNFGSGNSWNFRGINNKANVKARIEGARVKEHTRRGQLKELYNQKQNEQYIIVKEDLK